MAQVTHFFAGANSGDGFQNLFSEIVDLEDTYDLMVLKGGPGVGKNTFMREIGRTMEDAGTPVEYLWCSGDPDSLDGVVLPELRCAVVDGTAPHIIEPKYPAAVDRYVDLGRFYDLTAAKAAAEEVKAHTHAYKAAYVRAYHHLKAARQVELDAVAAVQKTFDREKAARRTGGIIARELRRRGMRRGGPPAAFWAASPTRDTSGGLTAWTPCAPGSTSWRTAGSWRGRCSPGSTGRRRTADGTPSPAARRSSRTGWSTC